MGGSVNKFITDRDRKEKELMTVFSVIFDHLLRVKGRWWNRGS